MSTDLGNYRVIADESQTSPSKEDWYQQIEANNSSIADAIRESLLASDFAPEDSADSEQWVTTLTAGQLCGRDPARR